LEVTTNSCAIQQQANFRHPHMKNIIAPTIPFVLSTTLTGLGCYFVGMPRQDLVIAIAVAALVSGSVAYGSAFAGSRKIVDTSNPA
jgi:hypothetical protein